MVSGPNFEFRMVILCRALVRILKVLARNFFLLINFFLPFVSQKVPVLTRALGHMQHLAPRCLFLELIQEAFLLHKMAKWWIYRNVSRIMKIVHSGYVLYLICKLQNCGRDDRLVRWAGERKMHFLTIITLYTYTLPVVGILLHFKTFL